MTRKSQSNNKKVTFYTNHLVVDKPSDSEQKWKTNKFSHFQKRINQTSSITWTFISMKEHAKLTSFFNCPIGWRRKKFFCALNKHHSKSPEFFLKIFAWKFRANANGMKEEKSWMYLPIQHFVGSIDCVRLRSKLWLLSKRLVYLLQGCLWSSRLC